MNFKHLAHEMDIYPWPNGLGFKGGQEWWAQALNQSEKERLEFMLMLALLSEDVCRLLLQHDSALLDLFKLSPTTISTLSAIQATSLDEFAALMRDSGL